MSRIPPPEAPAARLMLAQLRAEAEARLAAATAPPPAAEAAASGADEPVPADRRAAAGALAKALQHTAIAAATAAPEESPMAPAATLSAAARAVARLLLQPLADSERGAALERIALTQLHAPGDALAGELRQSLQRSGIFYESHLRAWDAGRYPLADLRHEPQARSSESRAPDSAAVVPRTLEPLVREQLATLETRTAVLPLMAWPGQAATLEVTEDPEPREQVAAGTAPAWRARLKLELPRLGAVEFSLALRSDQVSVGARARQAASRVELAAHAAGLRAALARSALALARIEVDGDER